MPRWQFENKITFGNLLTIVLALIPAIWAYAVMAQSVEDSKADILDLKRSNAELTTAAAADRLFVREVLAELRVDVGYLRRAEEDNRRREREADRN